MGHPYWLDSFSVGTLFSFGYEDVEVGGNGFFAELADHERDLSAVIGGMIGDVVHQVDELDMRLLEREHLLEGLIVLAVNEVREFFFDLHPFAEEGGEVGEGLRTKLLVAALL